MHRKPLYLSFDDGVTKSDRSVIIEAIREILSRAGAESFVSVSDVSDWKCHPRSHAGLTGWNSVQWYIETAAEYSRENQIDTDALLLLLRNEPWQEKEHYDVLVSSRDFYARDLNFCFGSGIHEFGMVLSTARFRGDPERLTTVTMHEMGHAFGLIPSTRTKNVTSSLGLHCTNRCIMRQGLTSSEWEAHARDRITYGPFCQQCINDLRGYFAQA